MTVVTPPLFLNVDSFYGADEMGLPYRDLLSEGVVGSSDLAVVQRAAGANMSVDVGAGSCWVKGDDSTIQPLYRCYNNATVNLVVSAADATNPRIDRVIAEVRDATFSGAFNDWRIRVVNGTPSAGATLVNLTGAAAVPNTALLLANVLVPAASSSVITANISDQRARSTVGGGSAAGSRTTTSAMSGGPPASPSDGDIWIATAAGASGERWAFQYNAGSGSAYKWEFIGGSPVAAQDYSSQTLSVSGSITPLTSMSLTVPRAGDYVFTGDNWGSGSTAGAGTIILGLSQNSTTVNLVVISQIVTGGISFPYFTAGRYKVSGAAASDVFRLTYNQNGTNPTSLGRHMSVVPVRIS